MGQADAAAMSAFVLAGLPTARTRTSSAESAVMAAPCGAKIRPVFPTAASASRTTGEISLPRVVEAWLASVP